MPEVNKACEGMGWGQTHIDMNLILQTIILSHTLPRTYQDTKSAIFLAYFGNTNTKIIYKLFLTKYSSGLNTMISRKKGI
jgi:hypothetical protein